MGCFFHDEYVAIILDFSRGLPDYQARFERYIRFDREKPHYEDSSLPNVFDRMEAIFVNEIIIFFEYWRMLANPKKIILQSDSANVSLNDIREAVDTVMRNLLKKTL